MMILILNFFPFTTRRENKIEGFSEAYILVVLYHMFLMTDFVPMQHLETRKGIGYSCILTIVAGLLYFVLSLLLDIVFKFYMRMKKKYYQREFEKKKIEKILLYK